MATEFENRLRELGKHPLKSAGIETLQVNVGKRCNLSCKHCHVEAGPDRNEVMSTDTMQQCLNALEKGSIKTLDITGGAPELNPNLRSFIERAAAMGVQVMVRTNLATLASPEGADFIDFYKEKGVELFASMPCYLESNMDAQRGEGTYNSAIAVIRKLNTAGYGVEGSGLKLHLVFNPGGPSLPPDQRALEEAYKQELFSRHSVVFNSLFTITNVPIGRFLKDLQQTGKLEAYMTLLENAFNHEAVDRVMCRSLLSVGWDGRLYDCDFNQMLGLECQGIGVPAHIQDFDIEALKERPLIVRNHCYSCTAGAGSSCTGALAG